MRFTRTVTRALGATAIATTVALAGASASTSAPRAATKPSPPTKVVAIPGDTTATVSWDKPADNGGVKITGYRVTSSPGAKTCVTTGVRTCVVAGLTNGVKYRFTVTATNSRGTSTPSVASPEVTPASRPSPPRLVTVVGGNAKITASWQAPLDNGGAPIVSYVATTSPGGKQCRTTGARTCTITGLKNGTSYRVSVTAANAALRSVASDPSAPVTPATVPNPPLAVTAQSMDKSARVRWSAPNSTGGAPITSYTVRSIPGGRSCTSAAKVCTVTGLANGARYQFTVTAKNRVGDSKPSAKSSRITPAGPPSAPRTVKAVAGNGRVTISWSAPSTSGGSPIQSYRVQASPGGRACVTTAKKCTITNLQNGTDYTFTVTAKNKVGTSAGAKSNVATPATIPNAPRNVTATAGDGQAVVQWDPPRNDGGATITRYTVTSAPGGLTCVATDDEICTVKGLTNGTDYTFTVTAKNRMGTSRKSDPSDPVTPAAN